MSDDAKLFGDTDDAALFGDAPKRKDHAAAAEAMRGRAKVERDEERLRNDLETGPVERLGVFEPGFPGNVIRPIGAEAKRFDDLAIKDAGRAFAGEVGAQVVGSALVPVGEGIAAPIGRKIIAAVPSASTALTSGAAKLAPKTFEVVKKAVEHSQAEGGKLAIAKALGSDAASLAKSTGEAGVRAARAAAPAVAAGSGMATLSTPFANMIDRLRASAPGNPRAAELMSRINALQSPDFPVGTVTQSTGVE